MKKQPTHTPTPWVGLQTDDLGNVVVDIKTRQLIIAKCHNLEDAVFISRAVNCYEELLKIVKTYHAESKYDPKCLACKVIMFSL